MIEFALWHKIALYVLLLLSIFIFVKTSELKISNIPIIKLKYRIAIALFFPVILILAFLIGSIVIGIIAASIFILSLTSYFSRKKYKKLQNEVVIKKF
ncbi:MAG: hypothetical protein AABX08_00775 [Nanoarchaeota archaeon]